MVFWTLLNLLSLLAVHVKARQTDDCPDLFLRYSSEHSYCKAPDPTCNVLRRVVSSADVALILREHNTRRSRVASGKEQKLPPAGNMLQMVWDDELAAVAQAHAEQCKMQHDCGNCRRVQNFGVGQNIAMQYRSGGRNAPDTNWSSAIKAWYDEVTVFNRNYIDPFVSTPQTAAYGHFSQVVWAESWRIGCGYVLFQERSTYKQLYVCNYGPAGNRVGGSMYKQGAPCSACPMNSCCDRTCGGQAEYSGLCRITDNGKPSYKPQGNYLFYCDFQNQEDCQRSSKGKGSWSVHNTLSGNYLGIVLKGGEESAVVFSRTVKPSTSRFCLVVRYRKGPHRAGQQEAHSAKEVISIVGRDHKVQQELPSFGGQAFARYSMSLGWSAETEVQLAFSVPREKPPQFFEVEKVYATEGGCE